MDNKIVSAKLILKGVAETTKGMNSVIASLEKALALISLLSKSKGFGDQSAEVKKYREELEKLNQELKKSQGGKPGKTSSRTPGAKPDTSGLKTSEQILEQLEKQTIGTATAIRKLNNLVKEGVGRTDAEYEQLITTLAELKNDTKAVTDEVRTQQREFAALDTAEGSYRRINEDLVQLRKEFKLLSRADREGDIGKQFLKNIQVLDKELKDIDGSLGNFQRNVGNYKSAFSALSSALTFAGVDLSLQAVKQGLEGVIDLNAEASTAFTGVQKTVKGLTDGELADLEDFIKNRINLGETATTLVEQLNIAEVAGRLGVAKEEVQGFVAAIDTAVIALKDDLGGSAEDITTDLQKINATLNAGREDVESTADGILRLGSTINELAASGPSSASFLVDFAKRMAGIAPAAKVSTEEVLAFGAVLEEAGQTQEISATSFSQILNLLGADVEQFSSIAGVSVQEFSDLLKTSGTEALLQVLEGSGKVDGGLEQLADTLEKFGIRGTRTSGVLGALVNNTEKVREKIDQANAAFQENISLSDEADRVNKSLANRLANLQNAFANAFTDLEVQNALASIIDRIINLLRVLQESGFTITGFGEALRNNIPTIIAMGVAILGLSGKYLVLAARTKLLAIQQAIANNVFRANPFGLILTVISLVAIGLFQLTKNIESAQASFASAKARFEAFRESLGALEPVFNLIIRPIDSLIFLAGILLDALENFPATIAGVKAQFLGFFREIGSSIGRFSGALVDLGINFSKGLLFSGEGREILKKNVDELVAAGSDFANAGEASGKAYADARNKYIEENPPEIDASSPAESILGGAGGGGATTENTTVSDALGDGAGDEKQAASERSKAQDNAAKERKQAVERLESIVGAALSETYEKLSAQELEEIANQTESSIAGLELAARKRQEAAEILYQQNLVLLQSQLLRGELTEEEFRERREQLDFERQQSILGAEAEFLEKKKELIKDAASDTELIDNEIALKSAEGTIAENKEKLQRLREQLEKEKELKDEARKKEEEAQEAARKKEELNQEKVADAKKDIERSALSFVRSIISRQADIRAAQIEQEVEDEEERARQLEELRTKEANKAKALALFEIGINLIREVSALSVAAAPDLTQITRTILTIAAFGRAAAATAAVLSRELSEGGALGEGLSPTAPGSAIPYQGIILGPSHRDGGVMAVGPDGELIEVEGQEYKLQNGPESYIINRKSTAAFRPLLNRLASMPGSTFSARKKALASAINSYGGNGRSFEAGGVLMPPNLPIRLPSSSANEATGNSSSMGAMSESVLDGVLEIVQAINQRIDRIQVTANTREIFKSGMKKNQNRDRYGL